MSALLDYMQLCRLCLVKDKVDVPIFGEESDIRQIFLKITACLPVKVSQDDNLPKNICSSCLDKVDLLYQFWNTTVNAEKQLITWLQELGVEVKLKNVQPSHPHSAAPESIILKEEGPDLELKQNFQENQYSGYDMPYAPQVNMTVGAPQDFTQNDDVPMKEETKPVPQTSAKRRGRPPKQKTASSGVTVTPVPTTSTTTAPASNNNSRKRSSAAAAAARVAAVAANEESDDSELDDRLEEDDSDDEDLDLAVTKEEAESEEDDYEDTTEGVEPTTFVGVPSTSDGEQPGPSGLGGATSTGKTPTAAATTANESGIDAPIDYDTIIECKPIKITGKHFEEDTKHEKTENIAKDENSPPNCNNHNMENGKNTEEDLSDSERYNRRAFEQEIECIYCKKRFRTEEEQLEHQKIDHDKNFQCFMCTATYNNIDDVMDHADTHMINILSEYQCRFCGKRLTTLKFQKNHERSHLTVFICQVCGKKFPIHDRLTEHMRVHTNERPYSCKYCEKVFKNHTALNYHLRIHTKEKPYVCQYCPKSFIYPYVYDCHLKTHTGDRPYSCVMCGKKFIKKYNLQVHMKMHTNEKVYKCNLCEKNFVTNQSLKNHVASHTRQHFKCCYCAKVFSTKNHLQIHLVTHQQDSVV